MNANVFSQINLKLGLLLLGIEFRALGSPENLGVRGLIQLPFETKRFAFILVKIWRGLFVQGYDRSLASRIESEFSEFPGLVMRHKTIEVDCAHVCQCQTPPPESANRDVLGISGGGDCPPGPWFQHS